MSLFTNLKEECIQIGTEATNKEEILREIAQLAKKSSVLENISEDELFDKLSEREKIGSTGFENGIAIPHCRLDGISDFVVGALVIPKGVEFDALDNQKSVVLFFIIAPNNDNQTHIRTLSTLSRTYMFKGVKEELLKYNSPVEFREALLRHIPDDIVASEKDKKSQFTIVIQKEEYFEDILEILSALFANSSVIDAKDMSSHLHSLPLFSSFWNSEDKGFHKVVLGTINKKLVNELIRNIDTLIGGLEDNSGITITIQELLIATGSLNQ